MTITFKQGTLVYLSDGVRKSEIIVSDVTVSQTYQGSTQSVKTLHSPNKIDRTFSTEKGRANISLTFYLSNSVVEENVFNWAGFIKSSGKHIINPELTMDDRKSLYIKSGNTLYLAENCVAENISMVIAHNDLLKCTLTCIAPDIVDVSSTGLATFSSYPTDTQSTFQHSDVSISGFSNLMSCSLEITKNLTWVNQKSLFDLGNIYKPTNVVVDRLAVSGSITKIKTADNMDYIESSNITINYGPTFEVFLGGCSITERWDLGTVHTHTSDYVLLPTASESYIKF